MARNIKYIEFTCDGCGGIGKKDSRDYNRNLKEGTLQYCSQKCFQNSRRTSVKIPCANCGAIVEKRQNVLKRASNCFCSRSCNISFNNRKRLGILHPLYKAEDSTNYRLKALQHYGAKCAVCDYAIEQVLHVHHRDEDRSNNKLSNLIVLCPTHHVEAHVGILDLALYPV